MYQLVGLYGTSHDSIKRIKKHFESTLGYSYVDENEIYQYKNKDLKIVTVFRDLARWAALSHQPLTFLLLIHPSHDNKENNKDFLLKNTNIEIATNLLEANNKEEVIIDIPNDVFYESVLNIGNKIKNRRNVFHIYNYDEKRELLAQIPRLDRLSWIEYFMEIAFVVSYRSNCRRRMVGCVLVRENQIISTGYNGTASGAINCFDYGCGRCNSDVESGQGLERCMCLHAEENAILQARIPLKGAILYTTLFPCVLCTKKIIQLQFEKVYFAENYSDRDNEIMKFFDMANVKYEKV